MQQGFIKFLSGDKFGFIVAPSNPSRPEVLDRDFHFYLTELRDWVEIGQSVSFDTVEHNGKLTAVDVQPIEEVRLTGVIVAGASRFGGTLEVDGDFRRVPFVPSDVIPDCVGRRVMPEGTPVSFALTRKEGVEYAVNVRSEDSSLADIDPMTYREFGKVVLFNGDYGHLHRPNGDSLVFLARNIISEGVDEIAVGTWLQYHPVFHRNIWARDKHQFRQRVDAKDISVCIANAENPEAGSLEAQFLAAQDLPLDAPVAIERKSDEQIYSRREKRMTLRQLITAKRTAA